jgi:hypothetical protein
MEYNMKNWRVWVLTDKNGKVLAKGRKCDVIKVASGRYVYEHIFDDCLYRTAELLGGCKVNAEN